MGRRTAPFMRLGFVVFSQNSFKASEESFSSRGAAHKQWPVSLCGHIHHLEAADTSPVWLLKR